MHAGSAFCAIWQPVPQVFRLFGAAAVLRNPWAGCGFVEDLGPEIHAQAPLLGKEMAAMPNYAPEAMRRNLVIGTPDETLRTDWAQQIAVRAPLAGGPSGLAAMGDTVRISWRSEAPCLFEP